MGVAQILVLYAQHPLRLESSAKMEWVEAGLAYSSARLWSGTSYINLSDYGWSIDQVQREKSQKLKFGTNAHSF